MVDWQYHHIRVNSADKRHLMTSHDSIMLRMQHHPAVSLLVVCRAKTGQIKGLIWKCIFSWCSYYTTCCNIGCSAYIQWIDIWRFLLCSAWLTETVANPFPRELGSLWKLAFAGYLPLLVVLCEFDSSNCAYGSNPILHLFLWFVAFSGFPWMATGA